MRRALAVLFALMAPQASAETLITSLSTDRIAITSNFTGATLVVFGAIERDGAPRAAAYDVVATVRGPRGAVTVREKKRWGPFWFNLESRKYIGTPAFLSVVSNRPLEQIATPEMRQKLLIGIEPQVTAQGDRSKAFDPDEPDFRSGLIRIRRSQRLFTETPDGVRFLTPTLFRAAARIPGTVPLGAYSIDVSVLADGVQIAKGSTPFFVNKTGAEDAIAAAARNSPLAYGLATAALALLCGWIASLIFRRD
jgi:uncharacterized protein (TIGR02186 family)